MENYLKITLPARQGNVYVRRDFDGSTAQIFFRYKQVSMNFAKAKGITTNITDSYAATLAQQGLITKAQLTAYYDQICGEYHFKDCHMEQSPADIYAYICSCRHAIFGYDALVAGREFQKETAPAFDPATGIDQRAKKQELLRKSEAAIFLLTDPTLVCQMAADMATARNLGKTVYVCASTDGSGDMPDRMQLAAWLQEKDVFYLATISAGIVKNDTLQEAVDKGAASLFFYGEEGLFHCRDMAIDTIVTARPLGYHAQALCDQLGDPRDNVIYIPAGLDITPHVPIIAQTRLTYYHLAKLWESDGDSIYTHTVAELYAKYPDTFLNVYDTAGAAPMPIHASGNSFAAFDENKDHAVAQYVNGFENVSYQVAYFDTNLERKPVCYDQTIPQPGVLVHTVRIKKAAGAQIIGCPKGVPPRRHLASLGIPGTAVVSNFLFFMTPKLDILYNSLRRDRPLEQTDASSGHLDYMLSFENGVRKETFPLFRKCGIAMTKEGEFLFFNYRLGGGQILLAGEKIRWETGDVDPENPGDVCVYTPFLTQKDENADRETYRLPVGEGRVNIVILQDRLVCVRKGDVVLPGAGVVVSMSETYAQAFLAKLQPLQDGYYDISGLSLQVILDGPEDVEPALWQQVQWAYGGGLSMILDGVGMCDGDMKQWLRQEGWMTPHSRQTQESVYHKSVKHPRTIVGTAENGDLLLLVFSGRTWRSTGANYEEIIGITRALYPDVKILMNMDGGGSAVLGLAENGSFLELSCPAISTGSAVGMVRPISTMLYIPLKKKA